MTQTHSFRGKAPRRFRYNAALDGLRAMAVLTVLCFHLDLWERNFLGVDIMFVLSGFLITSLMLVERENSGTIGVRDFYLRRVFRLMPAFYFYVAVGAVLLLALKPGGVSRDVFLENAITSSLYVNNFFRIEQLEAGSWFGHIWSLSVEQQFYLMFPWAMLWLTRSEARRETLPRNLLLAALAVMSWRVLLVATGASQRRLFFCLDTRADELLIGCALAAWRHAGFRPLWGKRKGEAALLPSKLVAPLAACGPLALLALIGLSVAPNWLAERDAFFGVPAYTGVALLAALLVLSLDQSTGAWAKLFSFGPLVWLGRISYGFYLWHFPVAAVVGARLQPRIGGVPAALLAAAVTTVLALISHHLVEQRAQRRGRVFIASRSPRVSASAPVSLD